MDSSHTVAKQLRCATAGGRAPTRKTWQTEQELDGGSHQGDARARHRTGPVDGWGELKIRIRKAAKNSINPML